VIYGVDVQTLVEIGLTSNQSKIYLTLLKFGKSNVRNISRHSEVPRQEAYRVLDELQRMGLIEKTIALPCEFEAVPINFGMQVLMTKKVEQLNAIEKKVKEILLKNQSCILKPPSEEEYKLVELEGKARLKQTMKREHSKVQRTADIITTLQRWLQILDFCFQDYMEALNRKVKYRVVIAKPAGKITFPENIQALLAEATFELRLSKEPIKINAAVFDENEATINFFEGKSLRESPIIWTNHPAFILMCRDHFDKVWKSSQKYEIQNNASVR
jgi:sugar-specific transcriptional regulator TrmB